MKSHRASRAAIVAFAALALLPYAASADKPSAPFGDLGYRSLGPAIAGGRSTSVAGSDRDPMLYYAGGADGGVFKSVDGGASWLPVFDKMPVAAIGAIAISPQNPQDVWVGTGESNPRNDVARGEGVWHTADGGKNWTHAGLDDAGQVSSISIDPRDPRTVVAGALGPVFRDGTTRGVFVTHDRGAHWTRTLYVGPASGVSDLTRVPDRPQILFAGIYQFRRQPWTMSGGGPLDGLYRSDDGGTTWRRLTGNGLPAGLTGKVGVAAASRGRVYANIQSRQGELWRSDDYGATWKKMPRNEFVGSRPFYFTHVFVDPADRNRLIDVGLVLSMSTDGGRTFKLTAANAGWDYHSVWWSQDGRRVIVGSDEGVVMSGDGTKRWWQPYDLPFAQPYRAGLGATLPAYQICIGLQDDNSWCGWSQVFNGTGVLDRDWEQIGPGDGMWALLDPTDPDYIWSTSTASDTGQVYLWNRNTQQADEVSPNARSNADVQAGLVNRFNWDSPIAFTFEAQPRALVGGNVVFASADRGRHWTAISPDLTRNDKSHQQAPGGPIDLDISGAETADTILDIETTKLATETIWVGTDDGLVQLTRDAGTQWKDVTPPGTPPWGRLAIDPGHAAATTAYVAIDRHMLGDERPYLYVTDDYGGSWHSIAGDLPSNLFVRSIREDVKDANLLYAGTQRGVYISYDRGAHWQSLRLNMPATAIYDLEFQAAADDLVVASHGRGVWVLDDLRPLRELAAARAAGIKLFALRDAYRMFAWAPVNTFGGALPANQYVGANPPYGALIDFYLAKPAKKRPAFEIVDAQGRVVRHLAGEDDVTNHAGINRIAWDLNEDGPPQWMGTFKLNRGPKEGPEAVPGAFTVRMLVDGRALEQPLTVLADPRDHAAAAQYVARHDFLAGLFAELGGVNTMLDTIDKRLKTAPPAQAAALRDFRKKLTFNPRNVEDLGPGGLRERLLDALGRMSSSFQAPTAAQLSEAGGLKALYDALSAEFGGLK